MKEGLINAFFQIVVVCTLNQKLMLGQDIPVIMTMHTDNPYYSLKPDSGMIVHLVFTNISEDEVVFKPAIRIGYWDDSELVVRFRILKVSKDLGEHEIEFDRSDIGILVDLEGNEPRTKLLPGKSYEFKAYIEDYFLIKNKGLYKLESAYSYFEGKGDLSVSTSSLFFIAK